MNVKLKKKRKKEEKETMLFGDGMGWDGMGWKRGREGERKRRGEEKKGFLSFFKSNYNLNRSYVGRGFDSL